MGSIGCEGEPYVESFIPFLLSRIGLALSVPVLPISDARTCNRPRTYLRPSLYVPASADSDVYLQGKGAQ